MIWATTMSRDRPPRPRPRPQRVARWWRWVAPPIATVLAGLGGACTDLRDIQPVQCVYRLNGTCDVPDVCREGSDAADCWSGPYGACHTQLSTFENARCDAGENCLLGGQSVPISASACAPICSVDQDCPPAVTGHLAVCVDSLAVSTGGVAVTGSCVLPCSGARDCPEAMVCGRRNFCVWSSE